MIESNLAESRKKEEGQLEMMDLDGATNYQELMNFIKQGTENKFKGHYDELRGAFKMEKTGWFKEADYEDFESWLTAESPYWMGYNQYYAYLRVAKRYPRYLVEKIDFLPLLLIETALKSNEEKKKLIIEKVESYVDNQRGRPSRRMVIDWIKPLVSKKPGITKQGKEEIAKIKYRDLMKLYNAEREKNKEQAEKIIKLELKVDDQTRYIKELQTGERAV
jgi:hypothetical protein